jgi:hypothetical protein
MKRGTLIRTDAKKLILTDENLSNLRNIIKSNEYQVMLTNLLKNGGFDKIDTTKWTFPSPK